MTSTSLEGISEAYFSELIRRKVFNGYRILYPGIIPRVDMLVAEDLLFVEIEEVVL